MARARNIKPGFFANEELVELSFATRLLFIGLWTIADREGRMEDKPKRIKMALFPADNFDVDGALDELQESGFLTRYDISGARYIQVLAFAKHQNPHRDEKESVIPAPCEHCASTVQAPCEDESSTVAIGLIPDSLIPDSLIPESRVNDSAPQAAPAAPKKSRRPSKVPLPTDFQISESVRAWAEEKGHNHIERHLESFLVKVRAKGYVYADWDAAFQNAIADDWAKLGSQAQARASPGTARPEKFDPSAYVNRNRTKVSDERTIEFNEHGEPV
ncbi:hypothetical protein QN362_00465 [Actimicrobium sp. CCC2.4]|uniref:hypothetical protein n=1 Tax=Actimicrobium sp. CCC2.4 TaxID=3048606 RepID=UPI002AC969CF|nr:hypothetical protein [Actimicrobium sp. CCC2.4]MEB0133798.1 hypothetical protein [Actimicrobium sp. CCC2.4]WPX31341.1 hypothetical protein RHM62_13945 [Actimicrobium sp. CCC2.4]